MSKRLHKKVYELKKSEKPIEYIDTIVVRSSKLPERESLLSKRVVEGYGVIWGSKNSHDEMFIKGAFAKSISEIGPASNSAYKIKFRDEHGKSCSLFEEIKEDDTGLYFRTVPLDDVSWANDVLTQIKSGTLNNFSIGFRHIWDKVEYNEDDDCFMVMEAKLLEISVVSIPSDMETYAHRSAETYEELNLDVEEFICSLHKSKQILARKLITRCITLSSEPSERNQKTLVKRKAVKQKRVSVDIDYDYLLKNL